MQKNLQLTRDDINVQASIFSRSILISPVDGVFASRLVILESGYQDVPEDNIDLHIDLRLSRIYMNVVLNVFHECYRHSLEQSTKCLTCGEGCVSHMGQEILTLPEKLILRSFLFLDSRSSFFVSPVFFYSIVTLVVFGSFVPVNITLFLATFIRTFKL